ncbi:hypothetical protein [Pseudomonas sp. 31 E 6]|uniref:Uncharacterized protein n=1 Tax=Pseudomonas asgharzadehiana TaxID=2842349 RepID=A0ABX8NTF6_9PSED|nr:MULTISPECIES: hypothetical protein [Pseudomonas]QXH64756.1 hypothetical protein KSS96_14005 [Pseudomonas asgharzadehiana]CRM45317.1 hypothetical protein [Pseudomonas sp. 31 E 5]CRM63780.1 hypothetical protein [Pseudomonas sp. 31 E 6]
MKTREIIIINNGVRESALLEYEGGKPTLTLLLNNGLRKTYTALDLFNSFGLMRAELKEISFLCKGAKMNVHPSGMSSHMSNGLVAYELTMGNPDGEFVHIFAYEERDLTNDIKKQHEFCQRWSESIQD